MNAFANSSSDSEQETPPRKRIRPFKPPDDENSKFGDKNLPTSNEIDESEDDYDNFNIESDEESAPKLVSSTNVKNTVNKSILDINSVGFKMMQKMGFTANAVLGAPDNPNALQEPITITRRNTRVGIGSKKVPNLTLEGFSAEKKLDYQQSAKNVLGLRRDKATIIKLQQFCFAESKEDELITSDGFEIGSVNPLWQEYAQKIYGGGNTSPDDGTEQNILIQLDELLEYARSHFFYCTYCGVKYANAQELSAECPGKPWEDHTF